MALVAADPICYMVRRRWDARFFKTLHPIPKHDPEKWEPVFGQDHAWKRLNAAMAELVDALA